MRPGCIAAIGAILGIIIGLYLKSIAFFICIMIIIINIILKLKNKLNSCVIIIDICFSFNFFNNSFFCIFKLFISFSKIEI